MAVDQGPVSGKNKSPRKREDNGALLTSAAKKRNTTPRVRVAGGRIYDSVNGKTCHQCRQKTMDIVAACKSLRNNKPCPIMYCHKCLSNRYGEKAEEVDAIEEWSCPKCRDICNCSICMKRRGHKPTGILANVAKATGYSSVSELLLVGSNGQNHEEVADMLISLQQSPRKLGKENFVNHKAEVDQQNYVKDVSKDDAKMCVEKKKVTRHDADKKKRKQDQLEKIHDHNREDGVLPKENISHGCKKNAKKSTERLNYHGDETLIQPKKLRTSPRNVKVSDNVVTHRQDLVVDTQESENNIITFTDTDSALPFDHNGKEEIIHHTDNVNVLKHKEADDEIPLPVGTELKSVSGIDMHVKDAGNALQFLEFCSVFGKVLELKNGLSKHVLQDIFHGRSGRRAKFSVTVQFHIDLLSVLHDERGEECSTLNPKVWFGALKNCLSASQSTLRAIGLDLQNEADYATFDASQKLRLLNLLCDEVLGTERIRKWMDEQQSKHVEKIKEAKQLIQAAKKKEKSLRQKMKDDIAKAIIKKQGAPLSVSEHESIMKRIKSKVEEAHAKVLESKGVLSKNEKTLDAFRIKPIFTGRGGNAYWNFNSSGNSDQILRQNVGQGDELTLSETWFAIDEDDKLEIEKLVLRANMRSC